MSFFVGARSQRWLTLTPDDIRAGATLVGDFNPVHHDEAFAATTRFGGLFASGAHTSALLAGMVSQEWPRHRQGGDGRPADARRPRGYVGVDYAVEFRAPCMANRRLRFEWEVTAVEPKSRGEIIRLEGAIVDEDAGTLVLSARMTMFGYYE
ncbi:MaoC family dehydratase [Camelimonas abortus]|uniref:MaoC family dehydratase n=1 Tax=Camelimonas abortus TaxID=1017184 RepID=A0ABV7LCF0_9HYPH